MIQRSIPTTDHACDAGHLEPAIEWYVANHATVERPIIPAIRRRFPMSPREACHVLRIANLRLDWPNKGGADVEAS